MPTKTSKKIIETKINEIEDMFGRNQYEEGLSTLRKTFRIVKNMPESKKREAYLNQIDYVARQAETNILNNYGERNKFYEQAYKLTEELGEELRGEKTRASNRGTRRGLSRLVGTIIGVTGIALGSMLLSPAITGNAIAESASMSQNMMGMTMIIIGTIALFLSIRKNK